MPKKNKSARQKKTGKSAEVKALEQRIEKLKLSQGTKKPFAKVGGKIGSLFGSTGESIGKWLGSGIGSIFGSGDYTMTGEPAKYNILAGSIPQFSSSRATNIVCHREYIQDFSGTTAFTNNLFALNPGIDTTFPWLASVAGNYQEYRFHGLMFEFRALTTDFANTGTPGVVVMATNYNADVPVYATKQQMENSEFAVSTKPTMNLRHMIECAPGQTINPTKYLRAGAVPTGQDLRLYDQGTFQFATQGSSNAVILGELWVTYCVEFFKPVLPIDVGGVIPSAHIRRTNATALAPFGLIQTQAAAGSLTTVCSSNLLQFTALPGAVYMINLNYFGTTAVVTFPTFVLTGLAPLNTLNGNFQPNSNGPANGVSSVIYDINYYTTCSLTSPGTVSVALTGGTYPGPGNVDIFVTQMDIGVV
jgi:hypothetical protein